VWIAFSAATGRSVADPQRTSSSILPDIDFGRHNSVRTHLSLGKDAPLVRPIQRFGNIAATPIVGGLHQNTAGRSIQQGQGIGSRRS
jgi:hypothetical protein